MMAGALAGSRACDGTDAVSYVCPFLIRGFGFESPAAHATDLGTYASDLDRARQPQSRRIGKSASRYGIAV